MKLSEIKHYLNMVESVNFMLPGGGYVPEHFHITEVGLITRNFIDCGGTIRNEKVANFQLWDANDFDHRLKPQKLLNIIALSEKILGIEDWEIEVEYQTETIGKYGLRFNGKNFELTAKQTVCLASDGCGTPKVKQKIQLAELPNETTCRASGSGCC